MAERHPPTERDIIDMATLGSPVRVEERPAAAVQEEKAGAAAPGSLGAPETSSPASQHATAPSSAPADTTTTEERLQLGTDVLLVAAFAYVGVLVRYGTNRLAQYDAYPLFAALYAQIVGCLIMGVLLAWQPRLHPRLYVGLATGLCGSITTFSSFNIQAMEVLTGWRPSSEEISPIDSFRFVSWLTIMIVGMAVPIASLFCGRHFGELLDALVDPPSAKSAVPMQRTSLSEFAVSVSVFLAFTVIVIAVPYTQDNRVILFDCVFAPVGALLRFGLSVRLNPLRPSFPWGTFAANMLGTAILGMLSIVQSYENCFSATADGPTINALVHGLMDGFCGCVTTVSTFVVELSVKLTRKSAYVYGALSLFTAQALLLLMCGGYAWTRNSVVLC